MIRCPPGRPDRSDGHRRRGGGGARDHRDRWPDGRARGVRDRGPPVRPRPDAGAARGSMTTPRPWRARVRRAWPVARYVIGLALAALAFEPIVGDKSELTEAAMALEGLHWGWGLLRGGAGAGAGWSVVATFVVASVALAGVAAVGASVASAEGASLDLIGVIVGVLVVSLAMGVLFVQNRALVWAVTAFLRLCRRLTGWPRGELAAQIDRTIRRLTVVRPSRGQLVRLLVLGLSNWMLDCACLALSFLAVGASVPWKGLLLAYGAGQLAANLPITPGGLGVVEGSPPIPPFAFARAAPPPR